ncbi:MAG: hypothetical protein ACHREM_17640, partial [Polyangiales bacterium]
LTITVARIHADARIAKHVRYEWGLFLATKADMAAQDQIQPIAHELEAHSGVGLNVLHRCAFEYPDPPKGFGGAYMPKEAMDRLQARLRPDPTGKPSKTFQSLGQTEPYYRDVLETWADTSGAKARLMVATVKATAHALADVLVHGDGTRASDWETIHGSQRMNSASLRTEILLARDDLTADDRASLKAAAGLFACVMWSEEYYPLTNAGGFNLGTANMPLSHAAYREEIALMFSSSPTMQPHIPAILAGATERLRAMVGESGAPIGSSHYMDASVTPTLHLLLRLRESGVADLFRTEPRIARLAEFTMSLLTPPEPRFKGVRKLVPIGDGAMVSDSIYGELATGFRGVDDALAARLQGAWIADGSPRTGGLMTTLMSLDDEAPARDPALGDASFAGWSSVLRHGWGTRDETVLWLVDGETYRDHRHADRGAIAFYALGAPISMDWGSFYSPRVAGSYMHSTITPEADLGVAWDRDAPAFDAGPEGAWTSSRETNAASFSTVGFARASFARAGGLWQRAVFDVRADPASPIIAVRDDLENVAEPTITTWNLMATGPVRTPSGPVTPTLRTYPREGTSTTELASASAPFALAKGVARLDFVGQFDVDWAVFNAASTPRTALIGNWANQWTQEIYTHWLERQHILRIRGSGSAWTIFVPWRRGEEPRDLRVVEKGATVEIVERGSSMSIGVDHVAVRGPRSRSLATFGTASMEANGLVVAGGATELVVTASTVTITAQGAAGARHIKVPGRWIVEAPLRAVGDELVLDYEGGAPKTITVRAQ